MRFVWVPILLGIAAGAWAADRVFTSYASVRPVLDAQSANLPTDLRNPDEAKWTSWSRQQDKTIRERLKQGDLDSMVNFLLYGTSFTKQPRVKIENLTAASKSGVLRARVDDLAVAVRNPGGNERLLFLAALLRSEGLDPSSTGPETGKFIYEDLLRVLEESKILVERAAEASRTAKKSGDPSRALDRASLFRDRGVSLDTSILPDFSIEQTLVELKSRGLLRQGQVTQVAVIGPGLDFSDKNAESSYDYYPQQTLQPFALFDSLTRLGLAQKNDLNVSILDISARVIDHLQHARDNARKNTGYVVQLPRDVARPWPPELTAYWRALGAGIGEAVDPIPPPRVFTGLETRAVRVRPEVVLASEPTDLDIVVERLDRPAEQRFDLIVATNIFVYYDAFEQSLALENAGAMLKPGGFLLTNDRLPEVPAGAMRLAGITEVKSAAPGFGLLDTVGWYQRR